MELSEAVKDAIAKVIRTGDPIKVGFLKRLKRLGGFGIDFGKMLGGFAVFALSSLDAYAQVEPEDLADTLKIIGAFGRS